MFATAVRSVLLRRENVLLLGNSGTACELLIVDELGFVPLSKTGAELLFEVFSQRYERTSTLVTSNRPFLTGALLDRLTHHIHILEMNGDSYRLTGINALPPTHDRRPSNPTTPAQHAPNIQ